jgi:hypothetical protein
VFQLIEEQDGAKIDFQFLVSFEVPICCPKIDCCILQQNFHIFRRMIERGPDEKLFVQRILARENMRIHVEVLKLDAKSQLPLFRSRPAENVPSGNREVIA